MTADPEQREQHVFEAEEARQLIARQEAFALDIQDERFLDSEHVAGAVHIPESELESRLSELPHEVQVLVICADGERSAEVAATLRDHGYRAGSIAGGLEGWKRENLRVQPSPDLDTEAAG